MDNVMRWHLRQVDAVAAECGAVAMVCDVSSSQQVAALFAHVTAQYGRLDVLINNAGIATARPIAAMGDEEWDSVIGTNLSGSFYCAREAMRCIPETGRGGVIVNVGSSAVNGGRLDQGAYAASKAGIQCLTETLALEGKEHGVLAFCVVPRRTSTRLREEMFPAQVRPFPSLRHSRPSPTATAICLAAVCRQLTARVTVSRPHP